MQVSELKGSFKSGHIVRVDDAIARTTGEWPIRCDVTLSTPPDSSALVCQRWLDGRGINRRTPGHLGAGTHTNTDTGARP